MRKTLTFLVVSLLVLAPAGGTQADTDDLFALTLRPNVLILMDGSGTMQRTDSGAYSVSYGVDLNGNGSILCPGNECVADLDVDGVDNTRNDTALLVVLDLLDANKDGLVDVKDENFLNVRLGLMYYSSGGDNDSDPLPRVDVDYLFGTVAAVGTPYADIKKAIIDPIIAGVPNFVISVSNTRGPAANGHNINQTPTAEALEYVEHYWWPDQLGADPNRVCRQIFTILITDGVSDGFVPPEDVVASLFNSGTQKVHGLGVPEGFEDWNGNVIPVPGTVFTYQSTDQLGNVLTRDFTKKLADGLTQIRIELPLGQGNPPADCLSDCYAYNPAGGNIGGNWASAGYVGGFDSTLYAGNFIDLTNLTLVSSNIQDPEPSYFAKTFAVGFSGGDPLELDRMAASGGTGQGFFPSSFSDLSNAVSGAIVTVQAGTLSVAAPAVPSARSASGNALYLASFTPSDEAFWAGKLTAYLLQADGTIQTNALGEITTTPLWEAHTVLNATATARNIKTALSGAVVDFNTAYAPLKTALNVTTDYDGNVIVNADDTNWLINYVLGTNGTNPAWKLGDIHHSSPVVIAGPASAYVDLNLDRTLDTSFPLFRDAFKTRDQVLYVGSNGGMLHAFHAGSWNGTAYDLVTDGGKERWGFIPTNLLPKLQNMVSQHIPLVDGPPTAADVWLDGTGSGGGKGKGNPVADNVKAADEWHTVLVTGERRGGDTYFALDVTDPGTTAFLNDPVFLWEFTDTNLGETWSQAAIGKVKLNLDGGVTTCVGTSSASCIERWVAFVGGGYLPSSDNSSIGKAFFVIDMNTGAKLWEYTVVDDATMDRIAASPTMLDTDRDGFVDRVYVGDLSGNIWRFDLQEYGITSGLGTPVTAGWTGSKLFTATSGQPFYDRLAVAADPVGQLYIYGGTGDLNDLLSETSVDRFYAIQEHYPKATGTLPAAVPAVITDADLADTTGLNTLNVYDPVFAGTKGWFLTLSAGEKVLSDPEVFAGVLLVASFSPTQATCTEKGGNTTLYALSYLTGGGASDYNAYKAGTDGLSKTAASYSGLTGGVKISMPALTSTGALSGGDVVLFVCTSGEICGNPPAPQPPPLRSIDYWRDL